MHMKFDCDNSIASYDQTKSHQFHDHNESTSATDKKLSDSPKIAKNLKTYLTSIDMFDQQDSPQLVIANRFSTEGLSWLQNRSLMQLIHGIGKYIFQHEKQL